MLEKKRSNFTNDFFVCTSYTYKYNTRETMIKCHACGEELPEEPYRDMYESIRVCKCGAMNHIQNEKE